MRGIKNMIRKLIKGILSLKRKVSSRFFKFYTLKIVLPRYYNKYKKLPIVEDKVLFIEVRLAEVTNSFRFLFDEIISNYNFSVHTHFLRNHVALSKEYLKRCKDMMRDLATAQYAFVNEASNAISCVKLREETKIVQLWHGCGAFKKFGFSTAELIFGETKQQMLKYPFYKNQKYVTVSSPEVIWAFEEAMNLREKKGTVIPIGVSRTDIFYNQDFIHEAYEKLHNLMPSSIGKKVLLYAPTFRGRVARAETPNLLNIELFERELSEEYVLILKHHPFVKIPTPISESFSSFAADFSDAMTIEELLCVTDICISDYSSLVFEFSLFEKPMIFFSYDLSEYFDWRGFYYDYYELAPGPVFTTNLEMIDYIKNINECFDKQRVVDFRKKFMSACDGQATERILKLVFGQALEQYKREEPVKEKYHLVPSADMIYSVDEKKIRLLRQLKENASKKYQALCSDPVEKGSVVFITQGKKEESFTLIQKELENMHTAIYYVDTVKEQWEDILSRLAVCQFIIIAKQCDMINVLNIRKETTVIQLWKDVFSFEKFDYASREKRVGFKKDYLKIAPFHNNYTVVPTASETMRDVYKESFDMDNNNIFPIIGACETDLYFRQEYKEKLLKKIYKIFPHAKGKKIISYIPKPRIYSMRPSVPAFADVQMMFEYLKDDYILLYIYDEKKIEIPLEISKYFNTFICNLTEVISINDLLLAADIIIGDYENEVFNAMVMQKPTFFYAKDYKTYLYQKECRFDYEDLVGTMLYTNTEKMAQQILDIEHYDDSSLKEFKEKYLKMCDGKVAKRLVNLMKI